jgi:hypothetical protein
MVNNKDNFWPSWACQFFFGYPLTCVARQSNPLFFVHDGKLIGQPAIFSDDPHKYADITPKIDNFDFAVKSTAALLLASVEHALETYSYKKVMLFLSGGWDSRALAACLTKICGPDGFIAATTTYDAGNDKEERFAALVAQKLRCKHEYIPLADGYYPAFAPEALRRAFFETPMHVWMAFFLQQLRQAEKIDESTLIFDGYGGDILLRGLLQREGDDALPPEDEIFFKRFTILHSEHVLASPVYKTLRSMARSALTKELSGYPAQRRILRFLFNNRGLHGVAHSIRLERMYASVALPFMNDDFIRHVLRIDDAIRLRPDFYPAILFCLDERLGGIPSTNDCDAMTGWNHVPRKKHSPQTIQWQLNNIEAAVAQTANESGLLDWFSYTPCRVIQHGEPGANRQKYFNALEMLHCFALFSTESKDARGQENVLDCVYRAVDKKHVVFPPGKTETRYGEISRRLTAKARDLPDARLRFHFTMDVEAFPVNDATAYHTAQARHIECLIYSDFGAGSDIEKTLHANRVPYTAFFESYSPVWTSDAAFNAAARFFLKPFSEVGLHCHAFSIAEPIAKNLRLFPGWVRRPTKFAEVLLWGKRRLENALAAPVTSWRNGSFDIYPHMTDSLALSGLSVDSSLSDTPPPYI